MEYIIINGELYHHGIKGQKWGVRRFQNEDGTFNEAGKKRYFDNSKSNKHDRAADKIQRDIDSFKGHEGGIKTKSGKIVMTSKDVSNSVKALEVQRDKQRAKADSIRAKETSKIEAVRKYNKAFNKANDLQEVADNANSEMKSAYKDLGKTKASRVFQSFKGTIGKGNAAYERYSKAYDKAVRTQETADKAYQEMRAAYQDTGKNFVNRVYNNIKYDR